MSIHEVIKKEQAAETCPCGKELKQHGNDICSRCERAIEDLNLRLRKTP